jgi:N-acyl-D-amino-acid deacylase
MERMKELLRDSMAAGSGGFGAQILGATSVQRDYDGTPMITDTMAKEDLYALGSVLNEYGRGMIQVAGPSIKTTNNLAKASGRPIVYNAVTPDVDQHGQPTENAGKLLKWISEANNEQGLRIFGQAITSTATNDNASHFALDIWNLFDASPPWRRITIGTPEERIAKMQDPVLRQACKDQFDNPNKPKLLNQVDRKGDTNSVGGQADTDRDGGLGLSLRKLVYETAKNGENKKWEGMVLMDIAEQRGQHVVDAFLDVSIEDGLHNVWKAMAKPTNLTMLKEIANNPYTLPGVSDGGAHTKFITAGDFSTDFLSNLVRDNDGMSLEDAHWRISKYCAQAAGMLDRGSIAVGMPADILVYDYKNLRVLPEEVAYDFPGGEWRRIRRAEGYDYTIVNGVITFEGNRCTGATPGQLLRFGRGQ